MNKIRGIILLDGPDCAGKTTLANKIKDQAEKLGATAEVHHLGKPAVGTCWHEHSSALIRYVGDAYGHDKLIIADRHFLSEAIYGCVYRDGSEYPFAARHVDRLFNRLRVPRVICAPPVDAVVEKHAEMKKIRFEEYDSGMDKVAKRYLDLWHGAETGEVNDSHWPYNHDTDYIQQLTLCGGVADRLGWYHYDWTKHDTDTYARYILHELITEQELVPEEMLNVWDFKFTGFPDKNSVLLVGDKLSPRATWDIPFYANDGCSLYLAKTLQQLSADESRIVMANINDPNGLQTVRALMEMCGRVVVLGREAEKTMLLAGLRFNAKVRHPQHARRFSHNTDAYHGELWSALDGWAVMEDAVC